MSYQLNTKGASWKHKKRLLLPKVGGQKEVRIRPVTLMSGQRSYREAEFSIPLSHAKIRTNQANWKQMGPETWSGDVWVDTKKY